MGIYNKDFVQRAVLNEVYFGETSDIKKLQSCLSAFRRRCIKDKDSKIVKANTYEELIAFNRQAEKTFGFVNFCLTVQSECGVNACTVPITSTLDVGNHKKYLTPTKDGIKYTKDANYSCMVFIYYDLLLMEKFTDREIMAIILHEIGHNFSSNFDRKVDVFDDIKYAYEISDIITNAANVAVRPLKAIETIKDTIKYGSKYSIMFSNSLEKYMNQNLPNIVIARDTMKRIISNALNVVKQLYLITGNIGKIIAIENDPIKYIEDWLDGKKQKLSIKSFISINGLLSHLLGYDDEKLSDSFATMYGYGEDLSKGLIKIEGLETKHYKNKKGELYEYPLYIHFLNLIIMPLNILFSASSPHPTVTARLYNQIDYLEKEIKRNNVDPKMEKEIKKQIQDIKKIMQKNILEPARNKDKADLNMVNKMYYAYLYDKFDGGDYRNNIFNKTDLHKQIQDIYNDKRKNKE